MKIYEYTPGTVISGERTVALGFFDGVHLGHRRLLESAVSTARERGISSSVFTFSANAKLPKLDGAPLYTDEDKAQMIAELGIDEIIVADFALVKDLSAESFINDILIRDLGCRIAISGRDFRFGKGAVGNSDLLCTAMTECGRGYIEIGDVIAENGKISTTSIKSSLSRGEVEAAAAMLGTPYFITSRVTHGRGVGKTLGFPTINTELGGRVAFLRKGVYKTETEISGKSYPSLTNIGICPTFDARPTHAETFILDFDGEIYGCAVKIRFLSFIRDEQKFSSPEALMRQIEQDVEKARMK